MAGRVYQRLPASSAVLDLGCGCGLPAARFLANAGHRVTGVDLSDVQIERARRLVPTGTSLRADATELQLLPASFDAVVCLYALIHMPLTEQLRLIDRIATWLRPGGWLLVTVGDEAWTGTQNNWLRGPALMRWRHADTATYRSWLQQADLVITSDGGRSRGRERTQPSSGLIERQVMTTAPSPHQLRCAWHRPAAPLPPRHATPLDGLAEGDTGAGITLSPPWMSGQRMSLSVSGSSPASFGP